MHPICRPSDFPCQRKTDGIHGNGRLKRNSIPGAQCAPKRMIPRTRMLNTLKLLLRFSPMLAIAILEWPNVLRPQKKEDTQPLWLELQRKKEYKTISRRLLRGWRGSFLQICDHSVDYVRVDTIKDHLKSKKHRQRKDLKEADTSSSGRKQVTLTTLVKSKDLREEFLLHFIKMSTMVDIPLEKVERMRPFLLKYCKQANRHFT